MKIAESLCTKYVDVFMQYVHTYVSTSFRIAFRIGILFTGRLKMSPLPTRGTTPARQKIILTRVQKSSMCLSSLKVNMNITCIFVSVIYLGIELIHLL